MKLNITVFWLRAMVLLASIECCFAGFDDRCTKYYSKINEGKNHLIQSNLDSAVLCYKEALSINNYAFLKHVRQAAVIACFNNDFDTAKKLLDKCLQNGETTATLQYFRKFKNLKTLFTETKLLNHYATSRSDLNDSIFRKYLRINAHDRLIHSYLFMYSKDSLKNDFLENQQSHWLNEVTNMFSNKAYPPTHSILNGWSYKLSKVNKCDVEKCYKNNNICFNLDKIGGEKNINVKFKNFVKNKNSLSIFDYPLGEFFAHIAINPRENIEFYQFLDTGFNDLKIPQEIVALVYEGVHQPDFDFMASLNSYVLRKYYLTNYNYLFGSVKVEFDSLINLNRSRYFMDSRQLQKKLVLKLYELDQGVFTQNLNLHELKKIRYLIYLFASYSSL